ncbi:MULTISPECIES: TetR family transcriptional regulator C-terminal domain-containing protein [Flavobacterium]|uniref:TetR family transcriptional regulator C-terminal domain-containing protein n=1 Tax=Flavobacterium TaxID=237 RepID=UPI00095EAD55|nr:MULTISPECIES: TetR family transcriptional regulator C-terminal domain-containing protein [Flavobacterium]OJV70155.1 MAG: heat-shock protein [Flavobacterium sp. 40-81]
MAMTKRAAGKKETITEETIISTYMNQVLEKHQEPASVFHFCKESKMEETLFYSFFPSLDGLKEAIWIKLFENAVSGLKNEEAFETYSNRNKLLSLYFTFFEILTLNRSYVYFVLKENKQGLQNLKQLRKLRNRFKKFIQEEIQTTVTDKHEKIDKIAKPVLSEAAWVQFLFILKFWVEDTSIGFEKTDIMIEKSVKATFDILDTTPLESLFDLGKFVWKERFN